jgi:hypothetical protein
LKIKIKVFNAVDGRDEDPSVLGYSACWLTLELFFDHVLSGQAEGGTGWEVFVLQYAECFIEPDVRVRDDADFSAVLVRGLDRIKVGHPPRNCALVDLGVDNRSGMLLLKQHYAVDEPVLQVLPQAQTEFGLSRWSADEWVLDDQNQ